MNSTESGIKRFKEFYGEVTIETLCKFLGIKSNKDNDSYRMLEKMFEQAKRRIN